MTLPTTASVLLFAVLDVLPFVSRDSDAPSEQLRRLQEAVEAKKERARAVESELERLQHEGVEAVLAGEEVAGDGRTRRAELREELRDLREALDDLKRAEEELEVPLTVERMEEARDDYWSHRREAKSRQAVVLDLMERLLSAFVDYAGAAEQVGEAARRFNEARHELEHNHGRDPDSLPRRLSGVDHELLEGVPRWQRLFLKRLPAVVSMYRDGLR